MSEQFMEQAKASMGGISGYVDKELRRDADKRLRELIAGQLNEENQRLIAVQKQLLSNGGLRGLADIDQVIQKLQTLTDRIRTASYGYAGLFDAVKIGEVQLTALHQFDTALATEVTKISDGVTHLESAITNKEAVQPLLQELAGAVTAMDTLFNRRREAVVDPALLQNQG